MEKFSEFSFDSNPSNNSPRSYNKDNNIYNSTNIDISRNTHTFTKLEYYMLSNLIISEAAKKYYKDYESDTTPQSYIAFYFKEVTKYTTLFTPALKKFLKQFNKKENNLDDAINIFVKTFSNQAEKKEIKKASFWGGLKPGEYLECKKSLLTKKITYNTEINNELSQAIQTINQIALKIDKTSYDKNLKYLYIDFLSQFNNNETTSAQSENKIIEPRKKQIITPPKEKIQEKISKIILPTLKINKVFPTSSTHSRIDSAYFAFKFVEGYRAFSIIEKYHFKQVKYTEGFETKRKSLFEVKKSDFDLF